MQDSGTGRRTRIAPLVVLALGRIGQLVLLAAGVVLVAVLGTGFWLAGEPVASALPWWAAFLVLTIVAERLELAALGRLDRSGVLALGAFVSLLVAALAAWQASDDAGARLAGAAYVGIAGWLAVYDLARRTIRLPGLPRFVAVALVAGYAWLGIAGALALLDGVTAGSRHDAASHAVLLGFVFSMIFAHAPIVFPALLGLAIPFRRLFYAHLGLLHVGLGVRVAGDLGGNRELVRAGGLLSAGAIALFLVLTAGSALTARLRDRRGRITADAGTA